MNISICMHCLELQLYLCIKRFAGILFETALPIIYDDQIKGLSYFDTLSLASLESLKYRRIKHSKKISSSNRCLHSFLPPYCNNEFISTSCNPLTL